MRRSGIVSLTGDFTLLKYVATLSAHELERMLGYETGRLSAGFVLAVLAGDERMEPDDFVLNASTRWSGGVLARDPSGEPMRIEDSLQQRGQDPIELRRKVARFFARRGGNTPAKVLPNLRHTEGMRYPDAEALGPGIRSGVPQFTLVTPKRFLIVRDQAPSA